MGPREIVAVFVFWKSWAIERSVDIDYLRRGNNPTKLNFYKQMDRMAANLQWLKEQGIPVVYTPFVESDDCNKWHARETTEHAIKLYRLVHNHFTGRKA